MLNVSVAASSSVAQRRCKMPGYRLRIRPISSHLEGTSLVNKGFIIWKMDNIFFRGTVGNPLRTK